VTRRRRDEGLVERLLGQGALQQVEGAQAPGRPWLEGARLDARRAALSAAEVLTPHVGVF
jgi:hypothetical protein